jgi:hypothetical protein
MQFQIAAVRTFKRGGDLAFIRQSAALAKGRTDEAHLPPQSGQTNPSAAVARSTPQIWQTSG